LPPQDLLGPEELRICERSHRRRRGHGAAAGQLGHPVPLCFRAGRNDREPTERPAGVVLPGQSPPPSPPP
ncbi:hypothetical protein IscW_ISCW008073, partial [Ixodes scapularis]